MPGLHSDALALKQALVRVRGMMAAAGVLRGGGSLGDAKRAAYEARDREKGPIDEWLFREGRWKRIQAEQAKVDQILAELDDQPCVRT